MKRLISLVLAVLLNLSLASCTPAAPTETAAPAETVTPETTVPATLPSYPVAENPVEFFSLTLGEDYENIRSLTAFLNEDGTAHVEYIGDVKKIGTMEADIFNGITAALADSGLDALNDQDLWGEGEANGSMYITYADESMLICNFGGEVPQAYRDGYAKMEAFFAQLTASMPEYVPQPMVMGDVEETLLAELTGIINGSGMSNPDAFTISPVVKDEYFAYSLGLSSDEGIADAALCAPMMMVTAYSMAIVKLEEGSNQDAICADFAANVDWTKWVCVTPNNALVAVKDDLVLCVVAEGQLYSFMTIGLEKTGWTVVETMKNPMQ